MTASPWPSPARLRANEGASRTQTVLTCLSRSTFKVFALLALSCLCIALLSGHGGAKLVRYLFQVLRCPTISLQLPRLDHVQHGFVLWTL